MPTVLITTGATVTFRSLLDYVVSPEFIENLSKFKVSRLKLQYGNEINPTTNEHVSRDYFERLVKQSEIVSKFQLDISTDRKSDTDGSITYSSTKYDFVLEAFPFSMDIDSHIRSADVVISHAGTGSIIDALKLHKKLVVIVNDALMDNHQAEIANEFAKLNYCVSHNVNELFGTEKLINSVRSLLDGSIQLTEFPANKKEIVESIIAEELQKAV
ncbi:syntenic homolog of ALG13_YEAST UDP-N-acetylglucosamine transferase subunit ALG13 (Asparagine linked glycosylation protein 13) [Scheffersomyces stipitis CBS 6054]|uniref:UDP-N-acetylglucosamine transferase subunit ALG13 n=1 Tax=Scheffersomyces stipitis (strain ATCC 58785 / CBS 6054 / NBRC 10063 / NRRL Y-11545) TaxID=322104 RepID=A3LX82_PICST|nr:syntenic homolog of ALG13_YEAST UDP-N-acetylglucosamine transferase subunit ALG13 (Asparagine linked glycosylation protein 13) [Scheffersomyces stipitis CBS 6054]ABN67759.2 syntenic homolog of ALG13_YEAST UDP-N-acetylglucosamine transferase subunit ALG13 (Asparagine linked glycosylation protein 13) [Scheffersomyces stipitis CBS 6054]KAG2732340.1 hypothetical protein G9P44_004757 [Scheffersomyces stipitis]